MGNKFLERKKSHPMVTGLAGKRVSAVAELLKNPART
jgi:hypothetical protein